MLQYDASPRNDTSLDLLFVSALLTAQYFCWAGAYLSIFLVVFLAFRASLASISRQVFV